MKKIVFFTLVIAFLMMLPVGNAKAASVGDSVNFNVDPNYDMTVRTKVPAVLVKSASNLYFYVESSWWGSQTQSQKNKILISFDALSDEFSGKIYPTLTSVYGSEWNPGIDGDSKITLLFESMNNNLGGYTRSSDEYINLQAPDSNQREMIYLPISQIDSDQLKVFLAHEFVHLIVFNQKDRLRDVQEETWLSEARSDYASTLLGYDDAYDGSNLQRRVDDFLESPSDSLAEWRGTKYDYATESLFTHYLVDHYGIGILSDSLNSKLVGIPSLNEALARSGSQENFAKIFTNWTIAMVVNDCSSGTKYCYLNPHLKNLHINPDLIFLPLSGDSSLSTANAAKNWMANWQKVIGGSGYLKLVFSSFSGLNFQVPYIVYDRNNNYTIRFLKLDSNEKGEINLQDFGSQYDSLIIIPSLQTKVSGFSGLELEYPYSLTVSISKKPVADIPTGGNNLCSALNTNLYWGLSNSSDVKCLQQFLKLQGPDIYKEGLVTGFFGNLTRAAVINFQKKYSIPSTGFVGILTRAKINTLINGG